MDLLSGPVLTLFTFLKYVVMFFVTIQAFKLLNYSKKLKQMSLEVSALRYEIEILRAAYLSKTTVEK